MTNGSVEGVAKPALTAGGAIQLLKGPLLDINMAQVCGLHMLPVCVEERGVLHDYLVQRACVSVRTFAAPYGP